ncbi:hypothetical protein HDU97_007965 [Phlyctochytrium planicorne]|nr:hypothetical protein HDU97_007965 [Phlyctochytrium planicorne]
MQHDKPIFSIDSFSQKRASSSHTQPGQRQAMLEWLETQDNFALLATPTINVRNSATDTGVKLKKTDGYRSLAEYVNRRTGSEWTPQIAKSRFESFMKIYKRTCMEMKSPHFMLTADDYKRGIDDIPKKLNDMCPCFDRIDRLSKNLNVGGGADADEHADEAETEVASAIDQVVNEMALATNGSNPLDNRDDSHNPTMLNLVPNGSTTSKQSLKWINNPGIRTSATMSSATPSKRPREEVVSLDSPTLSASSRLGVLAGLPSTPLSVGPPNPSVPPKVTPSESQGAVAGIPSNSSSSNIVSVSAGGGNIQLSGGGVGNTVGLSSEPKQKMQKLNFVTPERFGLIKDGKDAKDKMLREVQAKEMEIRWQEIELKRRECEVKEREVELRKMELEFDANMKVKKMKADLLMALVSEGKSDEQITKYFELFN